MDRMLEYETLLASLDAQAPELDDLVPRALARARRHRVRRRLGVPAASLGGVAAAFVLLVNLSTVPFALACGSVPVLRELAAAVAFSPSLKAAVEHDYVQYLGLRAEDNGFAMELSHLMADRGQLVPFLSSPPRRSTRSLCPRPRLLRPDRAGAARLLRRGHQLVPGGLSGASALAFRGRGTPPSALHACTWRCAAQAYPMSPARGVGRGGPLHLLLPPG